MPRVAAKPEKGEIMVALDSFCATTPEGEELVIYVGGRFRASDRQVRLWPEKFAPADSTDAELEAARRALVGY